MKITHLTLMVTAVGIAGCQAASLAQNEANEEFTWLMGCWRTEDAGTTERWQAGSSTHFFGSSVTVQDSETVFFEQMRLENGPDGLTFFAYPNGEGPSAFSQTQKDASSFTVENAAHDYPQKITYAANGKHLLATISRIDGSDVNSWDYRRCGR